MVQQVLLANGVVLAALESELRPEQKVLEQLVLVHGLFCRSVGLSDSHLLDNPFSWTFFHNNARILTEEPVSDIQQSLFTLCGKVGADLHAAVDMWLVPKGAKSRPTYLTALSPRQNERLHERYEGLKTPEERFAKLMIVAPHLQAHIARATAYFRKHPSSVMQATRQTSLADTVTKALAAIDLRNLTVVERRIVERMRRAIEDWNPGEGYFSRERLHEATYPGGPIPRVWNGAIQSTRAIPSLRIRNPWRHFVNALHNQHHADLYGLDIVASPELRVPRSIGPVPKAARTTGVDIAEVRIPATVYLDYLVPKFVLAVRTNPAFWTSLDNLDASANSAAALADHVILISEHFKQFLLDEGQRSLVRTTVARIVTDYTDPVFAIGAPVFAGVALSYGLGDLAWGAIKLGTAAGLGTHVIIDSLFSRWHTDVKGFRSFKTALRHAGGAIRVPRKK